LSPFVLPETPPDPSLHSPIVSEEAKRVSPTQAEGQRRTAAAEDRSTCLYRLHSRRYRSSCPPALGFLPRVGFARKRPLCATRRRLPRARSRKVARPWRLPHAERWMGWMVKGAPGPWLGRFRARARPRKVARPWILPHERWMCWMVKGRARRFSLEHGRSAWQKPGARVCCRTPRGTRMPRPL